MRQIWNMTLATIAAALVACGSGHECDGHLPTAGRASPSALATVGVIGDLEWPYEAESPDGRYFVRITGADGAAITPDTLFDVRLIDQETGEETHLLSVHEVDVGSGPVFAYGWSPDSRALRLKGASLRYSPSEVSRVDFDVIYVVENEEYFSVGGADKSLSLNREAS